MYVQRILITPTFSFSRVRTHTHTHTHTHTYTHTHTPATSRCFPSLGCSQVCYTCDTPCMLTIERVLCSQQPTAICNKSRDPPSARNSTAIRNNSRD